MKLKVQTSNSETRQIEAMPKNLGIKVRVDIPKRSALSQMYPRPCLNQRPNVRQETK